MADELLEKVRAAANAQRDSAQELLRLARWGHQHGYSWRVLAEAANIRMGTLQDHVRKNVPVNVLNTKGSDGPPKKKGETLIPEERYRLIYKPVRGEQQTAVLTLIGQRRELGGPVLVFSGHPLDQAMRDIPKAWIDVIQHVPMSTPLALPERRG